MENVLLIDTSGKMARVCILNSENLWIERSSSIEKDHGKMIMLHIDGVLKEAKVDLKRLSAVAVINGPGSYTGLRISLSTAKGICFANDIPLILLNNLDLIAHASNVDEAKFGILQARENEYFVGHYNARNEHILKPVLMYLDDFMQYVKKNPANLFSTDANIHIDTLHVKLIKVSNSDLKSFIFNSLDHQKIEDLFQSEPFYLKNVFINKINKL